MGQGYGQSQGQINLHRARTDGEKRGSDCSLGMLYTEIIGPTIIEASAILGTSLISIHIGHQ